ncbi:MAG: hypothetical protein QM742_04695 [Aquabacterium sp.]
MKTVTAKWINRPIAISNDWWQANEAAFGTTQDIQSLKFRIPQASLSRLCGSVHAEGTVKVYKDVYKHTPTKETK